MVYFVCCIVHTLYTVLDIRNRVPKTPQRATASGKRQDRRRARVTEKSEESGAHRAQRLKLVDENGTAVVRSHQTSRFDCEKNEWRNNQDAGTRYRGHFCEQSSTVYCIPQRGLKPVASTRDWLVKKQGAASSFRERRSAVSPLTATVMLMAAPFAHLPRTSRSSGTDGDAHHHTQTKANADLVSHRLFTEDELDYFARALKMYSDIHGLADGCTAVCASSCAEMLVAIDAASDGVVRPMPYRALKPLIYLVDVCLITPRPPERVQAVCVEGMTSHTCRCDPGCASL